MDYVTRQFVFLAKKFRKELRPLILKLNSTLDKHTDAVHKSTQASKREQSPQPKPPIQIHFPESINVSHGAQETRYEKNYRFITIFVSGVSTALVFAYATLSFWQYQQMIRATGAAQGAAMAADKSAKIAGSQLAVLRHQLKWKEGANLDVVYMGIDKLLPNDQLRAFVSIQNTNRGSKASAAKVRIFSSLKYQTVEPSDNPDPKDQSAIPQFGNTVPAGEKRYQYSNSASKDFLSEKTKLYLWGTVWYEDISGEQWVQFCGYLLKPGSIAKDACPRTTGNNDADAFCNCASHRGADYEK